MRHGVFRKRCKNGKSISVCRSLEAHKTDETVPFYLITSLLSHSAVQLSLTLRFFSTIQFEFNVLVYVSIQVVLLYEELYYDILHYKCCFFWSMKSMLLIRFITYGIVQHFALICLLCNSLAIFFMHLTIRRFKYQNVHASLRFFFI